MNGLAVVCRASGLEREPLAIELMLRVVEVHRLEGKARGSQKRGK